MSKKKGIIKYKDKADYNIKWETIYANGDITEEELNEFKTQLKNDDYRILNVIRGNTYEREGKS